MSTIFSYTVNILVLTFIAYWSYRRYSNRWLAKHYWPALGLKVACGLLLGQLFFIHYQGGDTIMYDEQAAALAELDGVRFFHAISQATISSEPVRAIYFVRLVAVIKWLTGADYWVLSIYFSMFSFLGCIYVSDKLINWKTGMYIPACLAFLYFPSTVFWSSGLLKESLAFGGLTFLIGTYLSWHQNKRLYMVDLLIALIAFTVIVSIKYYIGAVLIPAILYLTLYNVSFWDRHGIKGVWARTWWIGSVLFVPLLFFLAWLSPNLNYSELWQVMKSNHEQYLRLTPDGTLDVIQWFGNPFDLIINIPYLWFSGIFRPLIGEDTTFPAVLATLENTLLLVGTVYSGYLIIARKAFKWSAELLAFVFYVAVLSVFLSYSAPNFGTLARYKIYYVPFVVMVIAHQLRSLKISVKH